MSESGWYGLEEAEDVETDIMPEMADGVLIAIMSAGLIGKRVIIDYIEVRPTRDNLVFSVESRGDSAVVIFEDGREYDLQHAQTIVIEDDPGPLGTKIL